MVYYFKESFSFYFNTKPFFFVFDDLPDATVFFLSNDIFYPLLRPWAFQFCFLVKVQHL